MKTITNELSWSASRMSTFRQCKRRYYWAYYGKWGGWDRTADEATRKAYLLSKMTSLPAAVGTVVHRAIKRMIVGIMNGRPSAADAETVNARRELANMWADAKDELWRHNPKRTPPFDELYYGPEPDAIALKSFGAHVRNCVETFASSWLNLDLLAETDRNWLAWDQGDGFSSNENWQIAGHRIFALPDFLRVRNDAFEVWDWKTGARSDSHELQLQVYGAYARNHLDVGDRGRTFAYYLGDDEIVERGFEPECADEAEAIVMEQLTTMAGLTVDSDNTPKPIEDFEMTDDVDTCARCPFRELCDRVDSVKTEEAA